MDPIAPVAGRFISAVRRRILIIRIAESIAISMSVASALGLAVVPILWWRGETALPLAVVMLGAGCFLGMIWGISRRPSRLGAAVEADRQLGLDDLLGTIVLFDKSGSGWDQAVAAFADERCRVLNPSAVIVNRIGLRGWAGVGILGGLLITLALLTARPADVTAASSVLGYVAVDSSPQADAVARRDDSSKAERPPGPGGSDSDSARGFQEDRVVDSGDGSIIGRDSVVHSSSGIGSAAGGGMATTKIPSQSADGPKFLNGGEGSSHYGAVGDGAGRSDPRAGAAGENDSTTASAAGEKRVEPWRSATCAADAAAANGDIRDGRVPQGDEEMVRDYFGRE